MKSRGLALPCTPVKRLSALLLAIAIAIIVLYSNLKGRALIPETIEDATAAAQEVVHASVSVVQVGVEL